MDGFDIKHIIEYDMVDMMLVHDLDFILIPCNLSWNVAYTKIQDYFKSLNSY